MIELRNIIKTFNPGLPNQIAALTGVDLEIRDGEFVVVVGANGSGKSTLLNIISGRLRPSSGTIRIHGHDVTALQEHKRSRWIARVFQDPLAGTAPDLSILENFRLAALRTQRKGLRIGADARFRALVREKLAGLGMGLENKTDQLAGTLSGGQRQAISLLMCVMDRPDILLLDEPAAALDPRSAELVMQIAGRLIEEHSLTCLMITHNLRDALAYGGRIVQMGEGRVMKDLQGGEKAGLKPGEILEWYF